MKCIKSGEEYRRVEDKQAEVMVNEHGWKFISKTEYKKSRGKVKVEKPAEVVEEVIEKKSKKKSNNYSRKPRNPRNS